jgi:hypothetical protein
VNHVFTAPVRERVSGAPAQVIRHRVLRDAVDPTPEALAVTQAQKPALQPNEYLLHDVIHVRSPAHAPRHVWPYARLQLAPGATGFAGDHVPRLLSGIAYF